MAEPGYRYEQANSNYGQNSKINVRPQEWENTERLKRSHSGFTSCCEQKKVKVEEYGGEVENQLLNESMDTIVIDDDVDEEDDQINVNSGMAVFRTYEGIYKRRGNDLILTDAYRSAAIKVLKITVAFPECFCGFDVTPAIPAFLSGNRAARKILEKKLLGHCVYAQLRERALHIIRLGVPEMQELRRLRKAFSDQNLRPIFQRIIGTNSWPQNRPTVSFILRVASDAALTTILDASNEEGSNLAQFENDGSPRAERNNTMGTVPYADLGAAEGPDLGGSYTVNRSHTAEQADRDLTESRRNRTSSRISSAGSLPSEISESPAASSSRSAVSGANGSVFDEILSEMDQVPITDWDRRMANLKREANKIRLVQMFNTTMGLPYEEQLKLVHRAVMEK